VLYDFVENLNYGSKKNMKWKTIFITTILNFAIISNYAMSEPLPDTLKLKSMADDTAKCNLLIDLSESFRNSNTEKGIEYGNMALNLSKKLNYKQGMAESYKLIGTNLWIAGVYDIALDNYMNSLRLFKELKDTISLCKVYNNIGLVYFARTEPELARENYAIGLSLAKLVKSDAEQARILINRALLEREHGSIEKAIEYHYESLNYANLCNDQFTIAYNKCFLGKCFNALKKYDSVSKFFDESIAIFEDLNDLKDVAMVYNQYAEYLIDIKDYDKAMAFAQKGLDMSKKIGSAYTEMEANHLISDAYNRRGNFKEALNYKNAYFDLALEMKNESNIKSIAYIEAKHRYEEKLNEAEVQSIKKLSESREFLKIAVIVAVVLLILLTLIIFVYRFKAKNNQILTIKNKEITELNSKLHAINASKDKFFSILAHDLRSPFSGFLGLTKIMSENINELSIEDLQEMSKNMQASADNLYKLLDNLLLWSRMQRGAIVCSQEHFDLSMMVKQNVDIAHEFAKQKNIAFINNVNIGTVVLADPSIINTIFRNLISNAIKFTPNGGTIEIGAVAEPSKSFIEVYVKDSGIGMPINMIEKLFKIDESVSRAGTNNEPSTGLGLLLCYEFITIHGGKIWVESEVGKGSTFWFSLPSN
jgi:signal transduction histidine kinase